MFSDFYDSLPITPAFSVFSGYRYSVKFSGAQFIFYLLLSVLLLKCYLCLSCNIFIFCSQPFFFSDLMKFSYLTPMKQEAITISFQEGRHHIFVC